MDTKSNYRTAIFKGSANPQNISTDLSIPTDIAIHTNLSLSTDLSLPTDLARHNNIPAIQHTGYPVDRSESPSTTDNKSIGIDKSAQSDISTHDEPQDVTAFLFDTTTQMLASLQARILYLEKRVDHLTVQLEEHVDTKKKIDALYDAVHRHECNIHAIRSAIAKVSK